MAPHVLLLLLCSATLALHAAAAQAAPIQLFSEWLEQQSPSGTTARLASAYGPTVEDVCMREVKVDGCSCYGRRGSKSCCWSFNVEAEMACCEKPESARKGFDHVAEEVISTGKCSYTPSLLEEPVKINEHDDTVMKIGTFEGICTLNKESATCGEPACDGMSVTIQGDMLRASKVAFEGKVLHPRKSDRCEALFKGDCSSSSGSAEDKAPQEEKKVGTASLDSFGPGGSGYNNYDAYEHRPKYADPKYKPYGGDEHKPRYEEPKYDDREDKHHEKHYEPEEKYEKEPYGYEDKKKYYSGSGMVFMGTFYTVNRLHASKHATGVYQAVHVLQVKEEALESSPEGSYVARPNEAYFRFIKDGPELDKA